MGRNIFLLGGANISFIFVLFWGRNIFLLDGANISFIFVFNNWQVFKINIVQHIISKTITHVRLYNKKVNVIKQL